MKIMTVNVHSYMEKESERKLEIFTDAIRRLKPDIIAMQEVNQSSSEDVVKEGEGALKSFGISLKKDNYGLRAAEALKKSGEDYSLFWLGIKRGFEVFDEGLCFLSKKKVNGACSFLISKCEKNENWRKRMVLGIEVDGQWFYNVHMGRWDDSEEPFYNQWLCLNEKAKHGFPRWLMGDFNSPSDVRGEGYDAVLNSGWHDTYILAEEKDSGNTVSGSIDGWKDKKDFGEKRIDYIFTDTKRKIKSSYTVFNGKNEEIISDHFGVLLTCEGDLS